MSNSSNKKPRNFKTLKYGSTTALMIVVFAFILVLVNLIAGYVTDRFALKEDMTKEQRFSVSDEAKKELALLSENVNIYILAKESTLSTDDVIKNAVELIKLYNTETDGKISYEFLDRNTNQSIYEEYPEAGAVSEVAFIVKSEKRYIVLDSYDFYDFAIINGVKHESKKRYQIEEKIVGAILYVTSDKVSNGGFVTSHNETDVTMLENIFAANYFEIKKPVDLTQEVPSDIKNLVISAPSVDFSEVEIKNLDKYLSKSDNNLYVFIDGYTPSLPALERYLSEWGIEFGYEGVYDREKSYYNISAERQGEGRIADGTHILLTVTGEDVVDSSEQGALPIIAPYTRPIKRLWDEKSYNRTFEVLSTYDSSMGITVENDGGTYKQKINSYGPHAVGVIAERANGKSGEDGISRIVAFGSSKLADAEYLSGVPGAYNEKVLSSIIKYANPETRLLEVEPKIIETDDLFVYREDVDMLFWILVVIMPVAILACGVVIFVLRRRK